MDIFLRVRALWDRLIAACALLSGAALLVLALVVTVDVSKRWLTGKPIAGVFELSRVLLVFVIFLAAAQVQRSNGQLRVDILTAHARGWIADVLRGLDDVLSAIVYGVLAWTAIVHWVTAWSGSYVEQGLVQIPTVIPLGLLVIGAVLLIGTIVLNIAGVMLGAPRDHAQAAPINAATLAE